jgi:lipoate-protein ligase A
MLRLYAWADRPVVSLGYFQRHGELAEWPWWRGLPFVRRLTGGAAVVHDHDLTYSLVLPKLGGSSSDDLYVQFHVAVARELARLGIPAELAVSASDPGGRSALCFHRSDRYAVRVLGRKVLGSAQRRGPAAILMHGSLLLAGTERAPELPGLREILGREFDVAVLRAALSRAAESGFGLKLPPSTAPEDLYRQAVRLADQKYRCDAWNRKR